MLKSLTQLHTYLVSVPKVWKKEFQECCSSSLESAARECLGSCSLIKFFLKVDEGFYRKVLQFVFVISLSLIFL